MRPGRSRVGGQMANHLTDGELHLQWYASGQTDLPKWHYGHLWL